MNNWQDLSKAYEQDRQREAQRAHLAREGRSAHQLSSTIRKYIPRRKGRFVPQQRKESSRS